MQGNATTLNNQDFLAVVSDDFLQQTIALGRAGTGMPAWGREAGGQFGAQEIADLVAFFRSWQRVPTRAVRTGAVRGSPARGAELYLANCANCHGPEGKGNLGMGPGLNNPDFLAAASDGFLWETIARGREGTPMFPSLRGLDGVRQLTERDIDDLVAFIRSWDRAGRGPARASRCAMSMRTQLPSMATLLLLTWSALLAAAPGAWAHKLAGFAQVALLRVEPDPADPLTRDAAVRVLDPAGRRPVADAEVTARALHTELGSALRTAPVPLSPAGESGVYGGRLIFPRAGSWELTIDVKGRYVGDAHFTVEVAAPAPVGAPGGREARRPDLPIDWPTVRHLAMEWGHIVGFGLWLAATLFGLAKPDSARWGVVLGTWAAFAIEAVTGLYKMEYSTPFATPLRLFGLGHIPPIFFAREYVYTLVAKHLLMLVGIALTGVLTSHVWRTKPGDGIGVFRGLLSVNLVLSLLIAGAAAILGFYHAIVLHFS